MNTLTLPATCFPHENKIEDDVFIYLTPEQFKQCLETTPTDFAATDCASLDPLARLQKAGDSDLETNDTLSLELLARLQNPGDAAPQVDGIRVQAVSCESRTLWSLSLRIPDTDALRLALRQARESNTPDDHPISPRAQVGKPSDKTNEKHIISIAQYSSILWNTIKKCNTIGDGGIIVLAGATSDGKTKLAEALLWHLTEEKKGAHYLWLAGNLGTPPATETPTHYLTRRKLNDRPTSHPTSIVTRKDLDAFQLADVLDYDARRQKPAAVYYDEVRNPKDWESIHRFALSRHILITTTHATSLQETILNIGRALGVQTSEDRRRLGQSLCSVIHLNKIQLGSKEVILPTMWLRTPTSIASLSHPGLSSIIPGISDSDPYPGAQYFYKQLSTNLTPPLSEEETTTLQRAALSLDLGLGIGLK